jgi:hypothetical protein
MVVSTVALAFRALGVTLFFGGVITANIATVQMSRCLNGKIQNAAGLRWWTAVGYSGALVIRQYKKFIWKDKRPEQRLRLGYRLIAVGLTTLLGASVLEQFLRGKV